VVGLRSVDRRRRFRTCGVEFRHEGCRRATKKLDAHCRCERDVLGKPRALFGPSELLADMLTTHMAAEPLNTAASTMPRRGPLAVLSWVLLIVWLGSSAATLWSMEIRESRVDDVDTARIEAWYQSNYGTPSQTGGPFKLRLVHLYNPDCRCNRLVDPSLKRLVERYQSRGVQFLAAPAHALDADTAAPLDLPTLSAKRNTLAAAGVKSSPAALIFDVNGRLMYYGPYSDSAWCGSTGSLVEPVLDRALSGLATLRRPRAPRGCSCGW
jgi:hypothetical protein